MELANGRAFRVGDWLVQPSLNRISGAGKTVRVEPKVMQVLLCLAERPREVITRDHLFETVWAGTVVTDDVLTRSISELRKAFQDDPRRPVFIETIPKMGYRLIAPVALDERGDTSLRVQAVLELAPSLDVLPAPRRRTRRGRWVWAGAGAALLLLLGLVFYQRFLSPPSTGVSWHPVPFTSFPGFESHPAFSPDGNRIAFAWERPRDGQWDLYVKLIGTETPLQLTDHPGYEGSPSWSADGRFIAFMRRTDDACTIYQVPALGGAERRIDSCGMNVYSDLAWSPDGAWMAFNDRASPDEPFSLYLLSPTTLERRKLTTPPSGIWGDHDPAFSPDGRWVSFTRSVSEGIQDVYAVSLDEGTPLRLTFDGQNIIGHTWLGDDRELVFASNRSGRFGLWRAARTGGAPAWVPIGDQELTFPRYASNQQRLAYRQMSFDTNIWRWERNAVNGEPGQPAVFLSSTRWDLHPQYSPDGTHIAFSSNRSGTYEVWLSESDGGALVKLTAFERGFTGTPRWSPDGRHLVFDARPEGQADLYLIDAQGGVPRRLTMDPANDLAASWSQDGQWIYFTSNRSGSWEGWKVSVQGGAAVQLTSEGGYGLRESATGKMLYYAKAEAPGLWRRPVEGGGEMLLLPTLASGDWGSWALLDEGIYFIQRAPLAIAFFDFATGQTTSLLPLEQGIPSNDPSLSVSADGRWFLYGQVDRSESDIMLVEGFQ